jgi:ribosomal protein L11 methyltransferase
VDKSDVTYREITIKLPEIAKEAVTHRLMELGCLGTIERAADIIAYFDGPADTGLIDKEIASVQSALRQSGLDVPIAIKHAVIPGEDWNRTWKAGFKPIDVGERFTILPPWEEKKSGRINLVIDPGMAFGTGHHETTRSCLVLMEKLSRSVSPEARFLDLGTGTGLLAIAAWHLSYKRVVAVDIDPLAIEATRRNIALNETDIDIEVIEGDIARIDMTFDLIAANLISGVLINLAPALASRLHPRGIAILAGILKGQEDEVIAAMESAGLAFREKLIDGKWVSVVVERASE